jgi:hypothetical protein
MYRPSQLPNRALVISGKLQAGGNSICLCFTGVLLWPPRRPPRTACIHFRDSWFVYLIDISHLNFNFLCQLLPRYLFLWPFPPVEDRRHLMYLLVSTFSTRTILSLYLFNQEPISFCLLSLFNSVYKGRCYSYTEPHCLTNKVILHHRVSLDSLIKNALFNRQKFHLLKCNLLS